MTWMIDRESGMIQLRDILPQEIVYPEYHSEAIGSVWDEHRKEFCVFLAKYASKSILEIGGSNGNLAREFLCRNGSEAKWTIVEPNPSFRECAGITVVREFFSSRTDLKGAETIVHSHVLEHLLDPNTILMHIHDSLPENGMHVFSIPNLYQYLKNRYSNSINFEHTYFLTEYFADYLLGKAGFSIIEKKYFRQHSIFYATKKRLVYEAPCLVNHYPEYKSLYLEMIQFYKDEAQRLNTLMHSVKQRIFLFGAHIFSQFLLYCSLDSSGIEAILDNSSIKQGKRLYGTNLNVESPRILKTVDRPIVILKAGEYANEIKTDILNNINPDTVFWE